jgi:hypothetical protein
MDLSGDATTQAFHGSVGRVCALLLTFSSARASLGSIETNGDFTLPSMSQNAGS